MGQDPCTECQESGCAPGMFYFVNGTCSWERGTLPVYGIVLQTMPQASDGPKITYVKGGFTQQPYSSISSMQSCDAYFGKVTSGGATFGSAEGVYYYPGGPDVCTKVCTLADGCKINSPTGTTTNCVKNSEVETAYYYNVVSGADWTGYNAQCPIVTAQEKCASLGYDKTSCTNGQTATKCPYANYYMCVDMPASEPDEPDSAELCVAEGYTEIGVPSNDSNYLVSCPHNMDYWMYQIPGVLHGHFTAYDMASTAREARPSCSEIGTICLDESLYFVCCDDPDPRDNTSLSSSTVQYYSGCSSANNGGVVNTCE